MAIEDRLIRMFGARATVRCAVVVAAVSTTALAVALALLGLVVCA